MKTQIPLFLVLIFGLFTLIQFFIPHESFEFLYEFLMDWIIIIGIFALAVGIWSLLRVSVEKIKIRKEGWGYSYITLASLFAMIMFGFTSRNGTEWGWYFVFISCFLLTVILVMQAMISKGKAALFMGMAAVFAIATVLIAVYDSAWAFHFQTAEGLRATMFVNFFDYILIPIFATMFSLLAFFIASAAYRAFRARSVMASLLLIAALIVMLRFNPMFGEFLGQKMAALSSWLMNVPNLAAQRAIVMGVGLGIVATALKVILGIERGYMGKG